MTPPPIPPKPAPPTAPGTTTGGSFITPDIKRLILRVLNAAETGSPVGDYSNITILPDGPGQTRQVTYGRSQTTETGNLRDLIAMYCQKAGRYADELTPYVAKIGKTTLVNDHNFLTLLKQAGSDPVMVEAQDEFFDKEYYDPALKWFTLHGFQLPLSMLVIYDSFIQSGGILSFLREKFPEKTPIDGGLEKKWLVQYVLARHLWLLGSPQECLRNSAYRTRCLRGLVLGENWMLAKLPIQMNDCDVL
jgi:chitosanase